MDINIFNTQSIVKFTLMGTEKLTGEIGKRTIALDKMKRSKKEESLGDFSKKQSLQREIDCLSLIVHTIINNKK